MMISRPEGAIEVYGKSQGYRGLPVHHSMIDCPVNGPGTPQMTTAWTPDRVDLGKLTMGANVMLRLQGLTPPPQVVYVGNVPDAVEGKSQSAELCANVIIALARTEDTNGINEMLCDLKQADKLVFEALRDVINAIQ